MTEAAHRGLLDGTWSTWDPDSLPPSRWNRHIPLLAWIVERLLPQLTVEVGVGGGESFRPLCQVVDRFSGRAKVVGIDPWRDDSPGDWAAESRYSALADYCATRHPATASLVRMDPAEAVRDFADGSIDLLHITAPIGAGGVASVDPAAWLPKISAGGMVVITSADDLRLDGDTGKVWQQISEGLASSPVELANSAAIAQRPQSGETALADALRADLPTATALFRLLGERIEFRHALTSEPIRPTGIRAYVADLVGEHTEEVRRLRAEHESARSSLDQRLASTQESLVAASSELGRLRTETDYLLAKLADQGARNERRIETLQEAHEAEMQSQKEEMTQLGHRYNALGRHADDLRTQIDSIHATVSWRVTRPLRLLQRLRRRARRGRS